MAQSFQIFSTQGTSIGPVKGHSTSADGKGHVDGNSTTCRSTDDSFKKKQASFSSALSHTKKSGQSSIQKKKGMVHKSGKKEAGTKGMDGDTAKTDNSLPTIKESTDETMAFSVLFSVDGKLVIPVNQTASDIKGDNEILSAEKNLCTYTMKTETDHPFRLTNIMPNNDKQPHTDNVADNHILEVPEFKGLEQIKSLRLKGLKHDIDNKSIDVLDKVSDKGFSLKADDFLILQQGEQYHKKEDASKDFTMLTEDRPDTKENVLTAKNGIITGAHTNTTQVSGGAGSPSQGQTLHAVRQDNVMSQVERAVMSMNNGKKAIVINLKPDVLGKLRLSISTHHQQVMVKIFADTALVKHVIESNLNQFKSDLQNQGMQIDQFEVFAGGNGQGEQEENAYARYESGSGSGFNGDAGFMGLDQKDVNPVHIDGHLTGLSLVNFFA